MISDEGQSKDDKAYNLVRSACPWMSLSVLS